MSQGLTSFGKVTHLCLFCVIEMKKLFLNQIKDRVKCLSISLWRLTADFEEKVS